MPESFKTITLRVEEDLHREIKIKIAKEGILLKEYLIGLIEKDLSESTSPKE